MYKFFYVNAVFILVTIGFFSNGCAAQVQQNKDKKALNWTFTRSLSQPPRGGTTKGQAVTYDTNVPESWKKLQESGLSKYERDRRAILTMAGTYETRFEFIETILMDTNREFDRPYASWSTEIVKVLEDKENFISLQHIMVINYIVDGKVKGPFVQKHWRQDWHWQGEKQLLYQGDREWTLEEIPSEKRTGKWIWTVFQVDDSPRYAGAGTWEHFPSASLFHTETLSRPLPRRETTHRSDYKILMGKDTLLITSNGWFHEQKNFKHNSNLQKNSFQGKFLSREIGHNSYKRIKNFDTTAGEEYWKKTKHYWEDVRSVWKEIFHRKKFTLMKKVGNKYLFMDHFEQAEDPNVLSMSSGDRKALIRKTLERYMK